MNASSRNPALNAPAQTKKLTRNTLGGMDGEVTNKSLVGGYYWSLCAILKTLIFLVLSK